MAKTSACKSCGAPIDWLKHEKTGKRAPIDVAPSPNGSCLVNLEEGSYRIAFERSSGTLYTSHFATCPHAGQHRTIASREANSLGRSSDELAARIGVSGATVERVRAVLASDEEEIKEQLLAGDIAPYTAYKRVRWLQRAKAGSA